MAMVPDWLPELVTASRVAARLRGESLEWLEESKGMLLYGTIGHAAYLRADGSVWFHAPVDRLNDPDTYDWQQAAPLERLGAINLGAERYPQLRELLPDRTDDKPDCARCRGTGSILPKLQCPHCAGLGWVPLEGRLTSA
jgi:hypothetical protein